MLLSQRQDALALALFTLGKQTAAPAASLDTKEIHHTP